MVPVFDQGSLVNVKGKGHNPMVDEGESHSIIQFAGVGLRYGNEPEILSDITFVLNRGSFHFLTGPSGAGKTSLLRLMYLAMRPTRGLVTLFGRDISSLRRRQLAGLRRKIGVIFQDFRLLAHLSVFDNVALPLRITATPEDEVRRCVLELLAWVDLMDCLNACPAVLSGGQQQLVAVARAVVGRPRLLIADEPTGSVDDHVARKLMYLFDELNGLGTTVFIATHNHEMVERSGRPRFCLERGSLRGEALVSVSDWARKGRSRTASVVAAGGASA